MMHYASTIRRESVLIKKGAHPMKVKKKILNQGCTKSGEV